MRFPESSTSMNNRMKSSAMRACEYYGRVTRRANQIVHELNEVTSPHGVPIANLSEEDSMVIATAEAIKAARTAKD